MFNEKSYIRDLAKEVVEIGNSPIMNERRKAWSNHNELIFDRPLIYIRSIPFTHILPDKDLKCTTPEYRKLEREFLLNKYRLNIADDYIIEPYVTVDAHINTPAAGMWGVPCSLGEHVEADGSAAYNPSLLELSDIEKLEVYDYEIDEKKTAENYEKKYDILGDSIPIDINYQSHVLHMWQTDISTPLAKLRGLEQIMWDVYDEPEWLHQVLSFMQEKILLHLDQMEAAGTIKAINNQNQAMPYANSLVPPTFNTKVSSPKELFGYMAAQEYTSIGPDFFKEFMFDYQKPILERFGLVAYGCCEDLSQKIDIIKELKNLRRIAVSPFADVKKCAEQIGSDYVVSYRPNPATAVSMGIDEDFIRKDLRKNFDIFKQNNSIFDITLKDVETIKKDPNAIYTWTQIVRDEINRNF